MKSMKQRETAVARVEIERFTVISSKPFETVVQPIPWTLFGRALCFHVWISPSMDCHVAVEVLHP